MKKQSYHQRRASKDARRKVLRSLRSRGCTSTQERMEEKAMRQGMAYGVGFRSIYLGRVETFRYEGYKTNQ